MDKRCENWKQAQDQPQFLNPNNRCLHCAGDHRSHDCPMRHQHQAPPTNNPVGSTGTHSQYSPHFSQPSTPQYSQQSKSTVGSSTPMLMINNPQQFQQGHQRQSLCLHNNNLTHNTHNTQDSGCNTCHLSTQISQKQVN